MNSSDNNKEKHYYRCDICGRIFENYNNMDGIFINNHNELNKFYCSECALKCINYTKKHKHCKSFRYYLICIFEILISFFPGLGHFYIKLPKRAIFFMAAFFIFNYLSTVLFKAFGFGALVTLIYSFFDFYICKGKLKEGNKLEDGIGDIKEAFIRNKSSVTISFIIFMIIEIFRTLKKYIVYTPVPLIIINLLLFILVCIGIYIIIYKFKKK